MSRFTDAFPSGKAFLPVIHVATEVQTKRNVATAFNNGADGVFLIAHGHEANAQWLRSIYDDIRSRLPQHWIGLNFLDLSSARAIRTVPKNASALWVDDVGITDTSSTDVLAELSRLHDRYCPDSLLFGGVAFKYQTPVSDPAKAARLAAPYIDVITTSGNRTGDAPDITKIHAMRAAIGSHPLAIASGMTPENVGQFAPYADCFLVATGIGRTFHELDPMKVEAFAKALQPYRK
ncbi:MAG: BtpA/SgcQ family protein [Minisyncoccia bacterium]